MCREKCLRGIVGGLFVTVITAGSAVWVGAQTPSSNTIYACVNGAGLVRVVSPGAACHGSERPIQWNVSGPAGPQGPPSDTAVNVVVDCTAGEVVTPVLNAHRDDSGRLSIQIRGVCQESVYIDRDDVALHGATPGDGLAAPDGGNSLTVAGGQRVYLHGLTLRGGGYGLLVSGGAAVTGDQVRILEASEGLGLWDGTVRLSASTIEENQTNFSVGAGGRLIMSGCTIRNAAGIGGHVWGGAIEMDGTTVSGNGVFGIGVMQAYVRIVNSSITDNGRLGVWLHGGGVSISNSVVATHTGFALEISAGTVDVDGTTIEDNGAGGILAQMGTRLIVGGGNTIRNNAQHGVWLKDTSIVSGFDPEGTQITENGRWGIFCDPSPAVAQIGAHFSGGGFILNGSHVFGNTEGQISCPGIEVR